MAYQTYAMKGYNKASYWQLTKILEHTDSALEYLKRASELTSGPIKIVDYGCSEGLNSTIFFYELFKKFRTVSSQPISILHNDLPSNDWNVFFHTVKNSNPTYLQLGNIYYSALGKSFYNNIVAPQSVHFGFSSHSFHYLSKRPVKKEGEKGILHSNLLEQARKDMERLIRERINELAHGGIFYGIFAGNTGMLDGIFEKIYLKSILKLKESGHVTQDELDSFELGFYPIAMADLKEILQKFSNQIEILELKIGKSVNPYHGEYLKDNNLEKYANSIADFFEKVMTPALAFNFANKNLSKAYREEAKKVVLEYCEEEIYYITINLIIRKLAKSE